VAATTAAIACQAMDDVTGFALAAAGGDDDAWYRLVRATQAEIWRFCAHLGESASADDLTQEVYLRAIGALSRFRGDGSARAWLLAIARRTVADHIRAQRRHRASAVRAQIPPEAGVSAENLVVLRAVVAGLAENQRVAFVLTQVLGLSYLEAAEVCGCPVGTVRSRVARARAELVAAIADGNDRWSNLGPS